MSKADFSYHLDCYRLLPSLVLTHSSVLRSKPPQNPLYNSDSGRPCLCVWSTQLKTLLFRHTFSLCLMSCQFQVISVSIVSFSVTVVHVCICKEEVEQKTH